MFGGTGTFRVLIEAENIADEIWDEVIKWSNFAKDTVGKQIVKSGDSIGANLAESQGRFHPADVIRFVYFARGSLEETKFWLRRALRRKLMGKEKCDQLISAVENLAPQINSYINSQKRRQASPKSK